MKIRIALPISSVPSVLYKLAAVVPLRYRTSGKKGGEPGPRVRSRVRL